MPHNSLGAMIQRLRDESNRPPGILPPSGTVSLSVGDPDFPTPPQIVEVAAAALRDGFTHYADWNGDPDLRIEIARVESGRSARPYSAQEAVVGHGANGVLMSVFFAALDPGDRVVIPEPTYSLYGDLIAMAGAVSDYVPLAEDMHLDLDRLARAMPGARMVVLCNPGNPTGAVFSRQELETVAALAVQYDVLVLVDEAYADLIYDGVVFAPASSVEAWRDRLIVCRTLSKTFAMTGWRVGYALAPVWLADAMRQVSATTIGALNTAVQRAALFALQAGPEIAHHMNVVYAERREFILRRIAEIPGLDAVRPEGAFYVFARYDRAIRSALLATDLLRDHGVAVRPGAEYGPSGEGYIRLSFATDIETIAEGLDRIEQYLRETA